MAMGLSSLGRETKGLASQSGVVHLVGSAAGGAATGAIIGWLGSLANLDSFPAWVVGAGAVVAIAISALAEHFELGRPCQVPRRWSRTMPARRLYLMWGAMLGAGIVTLIPYPAYVLVIAAQAVAGPLLAGAGGALFGLARELPALIPLFRDVHPETAMEALPRWRSAALKLNVTVAVVGGALVFLAALL